MSNLVILPHGSGRDYVRMLFRQIVAVRPGCDPIICDPTSETFAMGTALGKVRNQNEDRAAIMRVLGGNGDRPWMLFVVCDGIGGMTDGAQAAEIALSAVLSAALTSRLGSSHENIHGSVLQANSEVFAEYKGRGGATVSAIAWDSSRLVTANVGDSRIWALNNTAELEQLTQDDSIAGQLQAQGVEGAEDARRDLLQFVGIGDEICPHVEVRRADGVRFMIATTDGAHEAPRQVLGRIAQHTSHPREVVSRFLDLSYWYGGLDNATVACFQPTAVPGDSPGVVEIWVPGNYWRIVRSDCGKSAGPQANVSLPNRAPLIGDATGSLRTPLSPEEAKEAERDPSSSRGSGESSPTAAGRSSARRGRRRAKGRADSSQPDIEQSTGAVTERGTQGSGGGHVQVQIAPAAGDKPTDGRSPTEPIESGDDE